MSDELIRKSDVLALLNDSYSDFGDYADYSNLFDDIDFMNPVNAVELPCKIGDTIYEPCEFCNTIHEYEVVGFRFEYGLVFIECNERELTNDDINARAFLTREEAEKALEGLNND